jgi:hypothetical protein
MQFPAHQKQADLSLTFISFWLLAEDGQFLVHSRK